MKTKTINHNIVFGNFLKEQGFDVSTDILLQGTVNLIPTAKVTPQGDKILVSNVRVCCFQGVDTSHNDLGCVTFYYGGVIKRKYCRNSYQAEILKKVKVYNDSDSAIKEYKKWREDTKKQLQSYKTIVGTY